jgi:hypothetical protein
MCVTATVQHLHRQAPLCRHNLHSSVIIATAICGLREGGITRLKRILKKLCTCAKVGTQPLQIRKRKGIAGAYAKRTWGAHRTVIRFVSISAKFCIRTVMGLYGTLVQV